MVTDVVPVFFFEALIREDPRNPWLFFLYAQASQVANPGRNAFDTAPGHVASGTFQVPHEMTDEVLEEITAVVNPVKPVASKRS